MNIFALCSGPAEGCRIQLSGFWFVCLFVLCVLNFDAFASNSNIIVSVSIYVKNVRIFKTVVPRTDVTVKYKP